MIKEAYVSQDIATRLCEKGFTQEAGTLPTQQMAMRWLREEKGIFIEINRTCVGTYYFAIWQGNNYFGLDDVEFETYELAVAFGLLFVLTKMDI